MYSRSRKRADSQPTLCSQYADVAPAYPLPIMIISVVLGSSGVERKSRRGDAAPSIQKDLVGLLIGRTMVGDLEDRLS